MKKLLGISLFTVLTAMPLMAGAADTAPTAIAAAKSGLAANGTNVVTATNGKYYAGETITDADKAAAASAAYVKGAYNAAISAVNKVAEATDGAVKSGDNISVLNNDAGYLTDSDLSGLATETGVATTVNAATATASNVSLNVSGSVTGDVTGNVPAFVNWGDSTATGTIALSNGAVSNGAIATGATATGSINNIDVAVTGYQAN